MLKVVKEHLRGIPNRGIGTCWFCYLSDDKIEKHWRLCREESDFQLLGVSLIRRFGVVFD